MNTFLAFAQLGKGVESIPEMGAHIEQIPLLPMMV
jgi:hypothetical protein